MSWLKMARYSLLIAVRSEIDFYYRTSLFVCLFLNQYISGYQKRSKTSQEFSSLCLIMYAVSTFKYLFLSLLAVSFRTCFWYVWSLPNQKMQFSLFLLLPIVRKGNWNKNLTSFIFQRKIALKYFTLCVVHMFCVGSP